MLNMTDFMSPMDKMVTIAEGAGLTYSAAGLLIGLAEESNSARVKRALEQYFTTVDLFSAETVDLILASNALRRVFMALTLE